MSFTPRVQVCGLGQISAPAGGMGEQAAGRVPLPRGMSARDARRLAHQSRLALFAADQAFYAAGLAQGADVELMVGMTHGSTSFLTTFHEYYLEFGPAAASPNAFSGGVAGAPLAAISSHLSLTRGGLTLVGLESCGLDLLNLAAAGVAAGETPCCLVGAVEEHSDLVQQHYARMGWYTGEPPPWLPWVGEAHQEDRAAQEQAPVDGRPSRSFPMAEGSVFVVLSPVDGAAGPAGGGLRGLTYRPVEDVARLDEPVDLVISGAAGGPQDRHELAALRALLERQPRPPGLLFSKTVFGETFAVGPLLSLALGATLLAGGQAPAAAPLAPELSGLALPGLAAQGCPPPSSVLLLAAGRTGQVAAGILERRPDPDYKHRDPRSPGPTSVDR